MYQVGFVCVCHDLLFSYFCHQGIYFLFLVHIGTILFLYCKLYHLYFYVCCVYVQ